MNAHTSQDDAGERPRQPDGTAAKSAVWSAGAALAVRALRTLVFFALARLITIESFGLLALAMAFVSVLQILPGMGFHGFIIQSKALTRQHLDTAFWSSGVVGLGVSALVASTSGPAARVLGQPELSTVLLAISPLPLLTALMTVPIGLLWRRLAYKSFAIRSLLAASLSAALSLGLALAGADVWALVAQVLAEAVIGTAVLWFGVLGEYRPGRSISVGALRSLLSFGVRLVGVDILEMSSTKGDDVIIGLALGTNPLGTYSVAYRLLTVLRETIQATSKTVAFSLFSRFEGDKARTLTGFRRAGAANAAVAFPAFLFMASAAPAVVAVALGDKWSSAAPVVAVLALVGVAFVVTDLNLTVLNAAGFPGDSFRFTTASTAVNLLSFLAVVQYGIIWVALAFTLRAYLMLPYAMLLLRRRTGIGFVVTMRLYSGVLLASIGAAAVGGLTRVIDDETGSLLALGLCAPIAVIVYLLLLRLLARTSLEELITLMRSVLNRGPLAGRDATPGADAGQ